MMNGNAKPNGNPDRYTEPYGNRNGYTNRNSNTDFHLLSGLRGDGNA